MKQATGIIPARYYSQRFPGKPLALIQGKPMIERVFERALTAKFLEQIIVATEDERIAQAAHKIGAKVQMTSPHHNSGTERVAEVAKKVKTPLIINIQGDEPLVKGQMIDSLILALQDEFIPMVSLMAKIHDLNLLRDTNTVKVVIDKDSFALYFSRSPLPFQASDFFYQHIGIYGYQRDFLLRYINLEPSRLEKTESLEQLRALEHGYRIKMIETQSPTLSVDTPSDIIKLEEFLKKRS
ncbi:3-deoxy-manno-octulosonate cytidylyltransferase [candidate division WOR-1 bacterium DG_54_3]|uniref:3-deoxy-manno-octulosonate cytidylyltransferase n=1 Tax=candidate division WOR-1 bacterium DG_54_3 TaxID=1703775 RepID=A0A0S7Y688_UNCSA|nr:MAG: 3-deoxy-manno-octulosonate cytidylyltransferase [candidate division WOR-1 bacterium DG_54_3]